MGRIEIAELENHRHQIVADVGKLVEKYRAIFDWDVPEVDQAESDRLIFGAIRQALDSLEHGLGR